MPRERKRMVSLPMEWAERIEMLIQASWWEDDLDGYLATLRDAMDVVNRKDCGPNWPSQAMLNVRKIVDERFARMRQAVDRPCDEQSSNPLTPTEQQ